MIRYKKRKISVYIIVAVTSSIKFHSFSTYSNVAPPSPICFIAKFLSAMAAVLAAAAFLLIVYGGASL